jgi:hypothetical protein
MKLSERIRGIVDGPSFKDACEKWANEVAQLESDNERLIEGLNRIRGMCEYDGKVIYTGGAGAIWHCANVLLAGEQDER